MAQHDYVIDNAPGLAVRTDIMAALQAIASTNSGAVAPANPYAGQIWLDTSNPASYPNGLLKIRNAANTAWGSLAISASIIIGLSAPTVDTAAATKKYVDDSIATQMAQGDDNILIYRPSPSITLRREAADQYNQLIGRDEGNKTMWNVILGYGAGKDFNIQRYDVNGAYVDRPLSIDWDTGRFTVDNGITITTGGIAVASGGMTLDNIVQKQSSSTANLYTTFQNSSGYNEWQWRMDNASKQFELRAYDGTSAQTYIGAAISARSSDGALYFPSGVYGRLDMLTASEGVALKAPGATDSPYFSFYQAGTRRGYFQYYNGAGLRWANDVTHDFLTILNAGGVDMLQMYDYSASDYYPVYHQGNLFYAGTSASTLSFPIGSYLVTRGDSVHPRNSTLTVYVDDGSTHRYTDRSVDSAGTLAGTWRARGQFDGDGGFNLVQRVA